MARRHYTSFVQDSARWDALELRDDEHGLAGAVAHWAHQGWLDG